ncbi:MAG: ATP-binding cassette domain-containing protein [Campylobacteraceae bacterium]|jgi:molybdate transport system ATP-binding protein|nr:ATP-binding cassette domain-containing protein [Campylobacteraceae bacterium]
MIEIDIKKTLHGSCGSMELGVDISLEEGSFCALSGQSGSGKTTFLRILAGLEKAQGKIKVDEEIWQSDGLFLPPQKRRIGFVFQDYALFNNMNVEENLLFVNKDAALVKYLLDITELLELKKRAVGTLSGGQKQRVALARALMNRPKLLLMDEPLSALDPAIRAKLQSEIMSLHKEFKTTTILVSHDPSEIYKLASRMIVLNNGKIIADGLAAELLLKTSGSQKFSFEGELLEIKKVDVIFIAVIAIGAQIVEVVANESEIKGVKVGSKVKVSAKAFSPNINPASRVLI